MTRGSVAVVLVGSLLGLCSCQGGSDGATTDATTDGATTDATATTIAGSSGSSDATTHGSEGETATNATTTGDATQTTTSDDTDASDSDLTDASDTAVDRCGDGVIDDGEDCDDGGESASCDSDCTPAVCGDGTHNASAGEGCDDGGESASCDADCSVATCGDGAINHSAGEGCDDGNRDALDGCELDCQPTRSGRIAVSSTHSCALVDGGVACWGYNASGQLGYGNKEHLGDDPGELPTSPVDIDGVVVEVAAGQGHTCVLLDTGDVRCWGFNHHGQLGLGHTETIGDDELPSDVGVISLGAPAVHIIAGFFHSCALLEGGALRCWGHGETGQLGAGDDQDIGDDELPSDVAPVDVGGVITQLDGGRFHTCALLEGGVVRCWGAGAQGQLGYGNVNNVGDGPGEMPPQDVDVGGVAIQIATGNEHSCALLEGGGVRCWGDGGTGQLGTGSTKDIGDDEVPSTVGLVSVGGPAARLTATAGGACALLEEGTLRCWGNGEGGTLGQGNNKTLGDEPNELPPPPIPLDLDADPPLLELASGGHVCLLYAGGELLRCWGAGFWGQLGYGSNQNLGDDPNELPPPPVPFQP